MLLDVALIDFGRAIDLEMAEKNNPIVGFFGDGCAAEDMEVSEKSKSELRVANYSSSLSSFSNPLYNFIL